MARDYNNYSFGKEYNSLELDKKTEVLKLIEKYKSNANITLSNIVSEINEFTLFNWTSRNLGDLMRMLDIEPKSKKLSYKTRNVTYKETLNNKIEEEVQSHLNELKKQGVNEDDFKNLYYNSTYVNITNQYGISAHSIRKIAKYLNLKEIKRQYTFKDLWKDLQIEGVEEKDLREIYTTLNYTFADTKLWIENKLGREIGYKMIVSLLKSLNIEKSKSQIKELQGRKSRKERIENKEYFENLIECTTEELAIRYENDKSLTKESLLKEINSKVKIGEKEITEKWLGKNIDKLLSLPRLGIVSRLEIELTEYVKELLGKDILVITSDRKIIAPKELDIVIPKLNTAIEFNGEYWHSNDMLIKSSLMTSLDYHTEKRNLCAKNGLNLLFVWEDDWNNKKEEVKKAMEIYFFNGKVLPILSKLTND